jgi:hypothetical protein
MSSGEPRHFDGAGREVDIPLSLRRAPELNAGAALERSRHLTSIDPGTPAPVTLVRGWNGPYWHAQDGDRDTVTGQYARRRPDPGEPEIGGVHRPATRRRGWNRWLHQRGQTVIAAVALANLALFGVIATILGQWLFPAALLAWLFAAVGLTQVGVLLAVILWARRG